jgi:hypothetical protein
MDEPSIPGRDWSRLEVEAIVADYLSMLAAESRDEPYSKAEHNRNLHSLIGRSKGAIERKHQNISAVLRELELPWIDGYKPLGNYQDLLREVVIQQVVADQSQVQTAVAAAVEAADGTLPPVADLDAIQVSVPVSDRDFTARQPPRVPAPRIKNYLEIESKNRILGLAGEMFVAQYEERRLSNAGRKDLAARIEHVSATAGDGLGYDVSSFELDGRPRLIEVKTTRFGALTPFYVSRNEVMASGRLVDRFQLYSLFNFRKRAQFFALVGSLDRTCRLESTQYLARVG